MYKKTLLFNKVKESKKEKGRRVRFPLVGKRTRTITEEVRTRRPSRAAD